LYDFLIPYRQLTAGAVEGAVRNYLEEPNTYLDGLTEAVAEPSVLFDAVKDFLEKLPIVWMHIVQALIAAGYQVEELTRQRACPNGYRSRIEGKREQLDWAASVCGLVSSVNAVCAARGFSVFGSGRGCGLLRTRRAECKLF